MHIIGILSVKNESDFIERSIRFNAKNIDEFYIADDNSSDETREIIEFLRGEGIAINLYSVASQKWAIEQNQSAIGETMLKLAHARGFDYAFLLDADELILSSRENTETELLRLANSGYGLIPWKTFIPVSQDCERYDYQLHNTFRAIDKEPRQYWKTIISHAIAREVKIRPGNHSVSMNGHEPASEHLSIPLGHFPVRSTGQFIAKIMVGYYKRTMKTSLYQNEGYHQLLFFEEIKKKRFKLGFEDLQAMALRYTAEAESVSINPEPDEALLFEDSIKYPVSQENAVSRLNGFISELSQHYISRRDGVSSENSTVVPESTPTRIAKCSFKGVPFLVSTFGMDDVTSEVLLKRLAWEPRVSEYLYRAIHGEPGVYFIDVGANIGYTTCIAHISGAHRVFSFECAPNSYKKLQQTVSLNAYKGIETIEMGLSDKSDEMVFQSVAGNVGASYIKETHIGWTASKVEQAGKVSVSAFDSLDIDYSGARKIILKLDVEGHELQVLEGMTTLLSDPGLTTIVIEYNPETSFANNMLDTTTLLCEAGFNDIELIFKARSDGWFGEEITSHLQFEKVTTRVIKQLLACGLTIELGFNRR